MAILPVSGRAAIAASIKDQPLHLAWGTGNGLWTDPLPEDYNATALLAEVGRRAPLLVAFAVADPAGDYEINGVGKFSTTSTPTNRLLLVFKYDYADGGTSVIREFGVFVGTEFVAGLPVGQKYFTPAQVADGGYLLQLENRRPIFRTNMTRETFEILIEF